MSMTSNGSFTVVGGAGTSTVVLGGEFDAPQAQDLWLALIGLVAVPGHAIRLDLGGVEFFGSPALRAVLDALDEASRHGSEVVIVRMSDACRRVFTITGFGYLVPGGIEA